MVEVLAKSYGEGFVKAAEALDAKPQVTKDDSKILREDVARLTKPIQDYNKALAGKIDQIVRDSFAAGKDDLEVGRILRARIPEILNNEPITIQRPGKRPVSFTADDYADMVANVVPYAVRNEGYIRGLKEAGADGWQSVAVGDERMCPMCGEKHGQVYGWDDPKPPYHPGCRCRPVFWAKPMTKEEIAESERIKAWAEEKPWENGGVFDDEPLVAAAYSADEQVDAVYNYQDYGYKSVNEVLRGINLDKKSPDLLINVKSDIAKIDSVFSSVTPSGKKIVVYRADGAAISSEAFEKLGIDAEIRAITSGGTKHLKPEDIIFNDIKPPSGSTWNEYLTTKMSGYEYEDLAYLSTSKKKAGAMKFLNGSSDLSPYGVQGFVELDVPEGVKFIDVDKFVGNQTDEGEILLNRGNKIVIDNVSVEMMQGNTSRGDRIYLKYKAHLEPIEVKSITTTKSLISAGASPDEVAEALIDDITRDMPKPKPTHIVESGDPITNIKAKLDPMDSKEYYGFRSKLREASDQVVLNHLNEPELRILDEHLSRLQKRCDDLGIPRLRGVADGATNVKAMASMSDGYLAVTPEVFQIDADIEIAKMIPRNEARILELEQYIKQNQSFLEDAKIRWTKNNQRLIDEGVTFEESSFYVGHPSAKAREIEIWAQEISECKSRVSDLKNRGKDALLNHWVPGNDLKTRPFAADEFFDLSQKPKILLDHEFGHHIHQQLGATKSNWKSSTTTEKKIATIYKKAKKLKDFVAPTKYSDSGDDQEWFAESYACYVNGRKDLVDKRLLSLFQELKL